MNNRIFGQKISCIVFTLVLFVFLPLKGEEWSAAKLFNGPGESDFFQTCFLKIKSTVYEDLHTAMMTLPTYVGAGTSIQGSDVTSISISQPSGTSIGDFLLAIISTDGTTSLAAPAGWTTLNQGQSTSSASTLSIFYRTADSAGSSSHNFTWSGGQNALGAILAYSGVDTSNPFDNFNAGSDISTGTSNNPTSPSKTTSEANTAIIYAYSADADYGNNTPYEPSGTTGVFGDRSGSTGSVSVSIGIARKDQASAGATGTGAFDMRNSNSEEWRAATLALRGVSSGGSNCTGNGTVISNVGVPNAANATGTPDGSYAELYQNGDEVILDLGEALSATTTVTVTYRRISASTPVWTIETSASANSGFSAVAESPFSITTGQNVVSTFTVTVPSGNQYLRFISNGIDADLDGITFTCPPTGCGPTAVSVVANQVTCNGTPPTATANSDASIVLNTATDGDRYLIVAGTDFGTQTAADATTFTQGDLPLTLLSNLANPNGSQTYTIRIFNGNDDNCSTEVTVTLNERDCNPTCDCKEYIYVNDEQEDLTHKFEINPTTGAITEIFSTGTTPWATGISDPHGLAQDINGGIYIGNRSGADTDFGNAGNIRKFSCDGVEDNTTNGLSGITSFHFNYQSRNGLLYQPIGEVNATGREPEVFAYDLCDGSIIGSMQVHPSDNLTRGYWGFTVTDTDWYVAGRNGRIYRGSLNPSLYTTPNSATGQLLFDTDNDGSRGPGTTSPSLMGIDVDEDGNIYVIINDFNGAQSTVVIRKYSPTGTLLAEEDQTGNSSTFNSTDGQAGFWGARGIVYSESSGLLYVGNFENCVTVFDKDLNELSTLNIGNPVQGDPKGLAIATECCPAAGTSTVNSNLCTGDFTVGDVLFLSDLTECNGPACDGDWVLQGALTDMTYESCNNSITITGNAPCGTFQLSGGGAGQQCAAFNITVEICVSDSISTDTPTSALGTCTGTTPNNDASITIPNIMNADVVGVSTAGASSYNGSTYEASATASDLFLVSAGTVTITGLEHSQTYILRLFNQGSSCFIDVNVTSAQPPTACQPSCSCTEKLYLNDEDVNEVHKFTLDNNTGALTEIGSPWLGNNTIIRPHGLAVDNNGRIYVGQGNTFDSEVVGPIFQMNCDGAVLDNDYVNTPDGKFGYNVGSANGVFYTPDNATNTIKAYSLCTGDLIGEMNIQPNGAFAGGWGFYVNQEENRWYYPDRNALTVYTGSLDTTLYTTTPTVDGTAAFSLTLPTTGVIPMGITKDAVGNYYIVFNTFAGSAATTYIRKYDASGNLLTTISDNTSGNNTSNGQSGFWGARGIAYSEDQNKLYVGSFNNCIAVFDTNLNEQVALNIGNPANTKAKGVSITKECCPTSSSIVIDTVMCSASVNQVFFLQDMINCEGTICEGIWQAGNGNTGMTYFSCDNSVRIDALSACGSFTLQSDGTSSNAQCGAFSISININVSNIDLTVTQNSCTDNNDGTFTANYTAQVDWSSVPCEVGEMINVTNNGTNIGIINPAMDSSPSTFSFSVAANGNGTNLIKAAFTAASCADSTSFKTPLPCPNDVATCASTSGCLGGNVFEDFNCNGTDDTNEPGVQGVEVQIYDCNNALVGTGFSDSEGDWQVCGLTDTEQYRVEFVLPDKISCWATPTHVAGSGNQSDVQFLTAPVCTQFSVSNAVDYCQTNPRLSTTCFESGTSAGKSAPALISSTYSNILNTNSSGKRTDGQIQEIGSAWGLAFQRNTQRLFTAASVKRHAGEGPRGFDGVYVFDYTSNGVPLLGGFDLEGIAPANIGDAVSGGVNISLGTVNRVTSPNSDDNYLPSSSSAPSRDLDAFDKAARVSFGDIDLSEDENTLWLVNLNQRALISVDVSNYTPATATPSAPSGTVNQYLIEQIPNIPNCGTSGTIYPWGLKIYRGKGYLGVICNGENSQDINDVTGYILSFEPNNVSAGFATELTIPMNYNREDWGANNSNSDGWRAWVTNWAQTGLPTSGLGGFSQVAYPQPVISDIEFADNGDMVIGVVDRFSVQMGSMQPIPVSGSNIMTSGVSNGDILHACQDGGTFILEDGGTTCGHPDLRSNANVGASSGTLLTNDGPGNNGEYYFDDYHQNNQFTTHKEIALGALAILRGENQVLATVFDPQDREFFENGYHVYNTNTGVEEANYEVFANGPNTGEFGKQAGLGDVEFICDPAPLEIGNYVWCDSIQNGIQDACERGISNLIVQLYDQNGNLVGQDTTVNGQYYFNQYNVDTTGITVDGNGNATPNTAWSGMSYSTQYFIVFGGGQFGGTEFTVGSEMYGITSMVNVGTNDNIDSDVDGSVLTSGSLGARPNGLPFIDMTTSATGCGDHKYDMGLTCTTPCEIILSYAPASCIDNMDGTFTATYDIIATWSNAPAGEMINIILDGSTTQTINASTLTSPQTIQFNLNADGNGTHMFTGTFATTTTCTDTLIIKAPLPCPNDIATCTSQTGCLGGNTFEDFNCNGVDDTHEPGVQGVRVEVYDCTNALVGTGFSDSEGDWQVCGLTDTEQYRVEFVLPDKISCWAKPTATGSNNNSSIQFMTAPNCGDFGLADPLNYNGIASEIVAFVPCYVNGDPLAGGDSGTRDWFVGFDYGNSGTGTSPQQMVDGTTIGAVWGVAYSLQAQKVFTSAFLKRHVGLGTLGSGGIYLLEPTANSFNVSGFYDLDANGYRTRADGSAPTYGNGTSYQLDGTGNVITYLGTTDPVSGQPSGLGVIGVNGAAGRNLPSSSGTGNNDVAAFDQVGKVSLGDLEISDDGKYLFVLNLYSREVVRLELDNPSNPTAVISVTSYALDDIPSVPTCTNGTLRPGALKYYRGDLYVGATCTNENRDTSIAGNTDLAAYIFKLNNATGAASFSSGAILSQILDFNKGQSRGSQPMTFQNNNWNNWTNDFTSAFGKYPIQKVYPTPWLTDIDFLEGGHMVMAFSDRAGHQYGFNNRDLFNGAGTVYDYQMGGHLLFAENVNGTFVMENGGQTPNFGVSAATRLNGEGPGGGEFYSGAFYTGGDNNPYPPNPFSGNHPSTAMGSVAALVGSNEIIISAMDPATLYSGGTLRLESNTGAKVVGSGYNLYSGSSPTYFGKAAGLGEVELRRINAPLEIGNYVWCDSIPNGIQDACERGISNLIVQLYDQNGNLVGQDTTVNGQYYFNQYNVDTTGITVDGNGNATPNTAWSGMSYSTQYFIVFGGGQFGGTEFTVGSEMYGITSMVNVGTNDNIDSDVDGSSLTSGSLGTRPDGLPFIDMTTSATGCGEHRFDMGVTCTTCTNPTASIFAIQNSCTNGAVDANTAYIQLSAVNNGDRFAISTGSTFTGNTDYSAATAIGSTLDTLLSGLANPTGSQAYTVRVFNGESNCFTDLVVTLKEQDCSVDCDCKDMLYVNDPEIDATHKFSINESTGAMTEIGNHWMDNLVDNPHGPATDINGFLYISDNGNTGDLYQFNCDGQILNNGNPVILQSSEAFNSYNMGSFDGYLYTFQRDENLVKAFNLCDKSFVGSMNVGAIMDNSWGFYVDKKEGRWYLPNRGDDAVYSGLLDISLYTNPATATAQKEFDLQFGAPVGITRDDAGNFYIIEDQTPGGNGKGINDDNVILSKYNAAGNFITSIEELGPASVNATDGQAGWYGGRGLTYSSASGYLYVSARDNCVAVFDTTLTEIPSLNIGNPSNTIAKGVKILKECCPTNNNTTIDTNLCVASLNDQLFLQELVNCSGTICEGLWQVGAGNTGMTYNACDNSVSINALNACGTFILESDGTGNNPQCGAFKITVNISVNVVTASVVAANQTVCAGGDPAAFTVATPATGGTLSYQWQSSTDSLVGYVNIGGATSDTYDPPSGITDTTFYRVIVNSTNAGCSTGNCADTSNVLSISVINCCAEINQLITDRTICTGQTIDSLAATTTFTNPDSIAFVYFTTAQTDSSVIYTSGTGIDTLQILGSSDTVLLTNTIIPAFTATTTPETFYVYAIKYPTPSTATCRPYEEIRVIVNPIDTTEINQAICDGTGYFFNGAIRKDAGMYFDTLTQTNGCDSIIKLTLTLNPKPDLATTDTTICDGVTIDLNNRVTDNANLAGTITFHSTLANANSGSSPLTNSVSPTVTTRFYVRKVTDAHGCPDVDSTLITVQPVPDLATTNQTVCAGISVNLSTLVTDNATGTDGTITYHGSLADAQTGVNNLGSNLTPIATTKYYIRKETTTGSCVDIDSLIITLQPLPNLVTTDLTICAGTSTDLNDRVTDNNNTTGSQTFFLSMADLNAGSNLQSNPVSPTNTTKYYVRKITTTGSCQDVDSLTITVQPLPNLVTRDTTLCAGQSVDLANQTIDTEGITGTTTYHTTLVDAQNGTNMLGSTTVNPASD
ncbi:MAG: SdrD B-like domain-containing protein [Bacteroidota bacterium]